MSSNSPTTVYDALNRPTGKTYSDGTPAVSWSYDTCTKGKGRVCGVSNAASATAVAYDALGLVVSSTQTTAGTGYAFGYEYTLAGGLKKTTYPSGRVVETAFDGAGRTKTATGGGKTYANVSAFAAHGGVQTVAVSGGAMTETTGYTDDLQMQSREWVAGAAQLWKMELAYGAPSSNNGNVTAQTVSAAGTALWSQSYAFDALNRLQSVSEGAAWSRTWDHDRYGNGWVQAWTGAAPHAFTPMAAANFDANNRLLIQGAAYDNAGNQTAIGGYGYAVDAEGRLAASTLNATTTAYRYDGEGRRVRKEGPAGNATYVYGVTGKLAEEYGGPGGAEPLEYVFVDHLGSTRLTAKGDGTVVRRMDYLPGGELLRAGVSGRTAAMGYEAVEDPAKDPVRFTGKERDGETGLDYFGARYLSAVQGRFTSSDPLNVPNLQRLQPEQFARVIGNPQNWNGYAYALNNPLSKIDPDGYLTIVVPGTWNDQGKWKQSKLVQQVSKAFGERAVVLNNSNMANTPQGRAAAAKAILSLVANHKFAEGENLNIVAHSHGGNAVFSATQGGLTHKIDTLVTLGTPVRSDYPANTSLIGNHINVFSDFDSVQTHGGFAQSMGTWGVSRSEVGPAGRTIGSATNVEAGLPDLGGAGVRNHSALWQNTEVWTKQVEPLLKK
jgi:RHS repeat-associated protein